MAHKRQKKAGQKTESVTLSDSLDENILAKLKEAKKELTVLEREKEEERQEQLRQERKQREKNKSFEQLLEEYGDIGSKY